MTENKLRTMVFSALFAALIFLGVYIIHPFLLAWYVRFFSVKSLADHLALFAALNAASFLLAFLLSRIPILRELVKL